MLSNSNTDELAEAVSSRCTMLAYFPSWKAARANHCVEAGYFLST